MTAEDWKFVNTFAPWFSALGTILAVLVSLHLARGKRMVRLVGSVEIKIIMEPTRDGYEKSKDDFITIEVVNTGETEAHITNLGWLGRRGFKRVAGVQNLDDTVYAGKLPMALKFGEEARWMIRVKPHWLPQIVRGQVDTPIWWSLLWMRCVVWTSTGRLEIRPSKAIRKLLRAEAERLQREGNLSVH